MIKVEYPEPVFRIRKEDGRDMIFDLIRKQWFVLNEEEWVRQNFVQFLVQVMKYPVELIAIEKEIQLGELKKRFDILVFDKLHQPWMLVECKAGHVKLDEKVFEQVLRYNMSVPVSYLVITNGHYTYAWNAEQGSMKAIEQLPSIK